LVEITTSYRTAVFKFGFSTRDLHKSFIITSSSILKDSSSEDSISLEGSSCNVSSIKVAEIPSFRSWVVVYLISGLSPNVTDSDLSVVRKIFGITKLQERNGDVDLLVANSVVPPDFDS